METTVRTIARDSPKKQRRRSYWYSVLSWGAKARAKVRASSPPRGFGGSSVRGGKQRPMIYLKSLFAGAVAAVVVATIVITLLLRSENQHGSRATGIALILAYPPLRIGTALAFVLGSYLTYRWIR